MLQRKSIFTDDDVINCDITYDSTRAIVLTKKNDHLYTITMFDIFSYEKIFEEVIGGNENQYIKVSSVAQNHYGN